MALSGFLDSGYAGCKLDRKAQVEHVTYLAQA